MLNPSTPSPFRSDPTPAAPAPRRPPDFHTAQEHHKAGRLAEAEAGYRQWLSLHPADAAALHMLGLVNHQAGRQHEALALLRQAVRTAGNAVSAAKAAEFRSNLAAVLGRMGRHADAAAELAEVVRARPDYAQGHCNLGVALEHSGRREEAVAACRRAVALKADYALAFNALGNCLRKLRRIDEAESAYRQAVKLRPTYAGAYANLAIVLSGQGRLAEVIECRRKIAELRPRSASAGSALLSTLHYDAASTPAMLLGMAREWAGRTYGGRKGDRGAQGAQESTKSETRNPKEIRSLKDEETQNKKRPSPQPSPGIPGEGEEAAAFDANHQHGRAPTPHVPAPRVPTPHAPTPDVPTPHVATLQKRLRIGFVSSNMSGHPEGRFLRPVLANLDRDMFETTCYSAGPRADAVTTLLRQLCDRWRDIRRMSDEQAAAGIRQDRIDILVDLTGHFGGNRLGIFARKPAPVQVTHFGYPGTSGMAAMDWRVTDEHADPRGQQAYATEKLVRLPGLAWVYDEPLEARAVGALPAERNGHVTFLCANNPLKVTPQAVAAWAKILAAVPESRLTMLLDEKGPQGARKERPSAPPAPASEGAEQGAAPATASDEVAAGRWLRESFAGHGIDPARVGFAGRQSRGAYFAWIESADIALDPFPYNGGVTTCDTLWMGVPVVSLAGDSYWSRQGLALLTNVGHPELALTTQGQYIDAAVALATELPRLAAVRRGLRQRMRRSPIADAAGYARKLEAAYRVMWRECCDRSPATA